MKSFLLLTIVFISLLVYGHAAISIITDHELIEAGGEEFNYIEGDERGPSNWGNLRREWETCRTGEKQSPIDLRFEDLEFMSSRGQVMKQYKPGDATVENGGHAVKVSWPGNNAGSVTIRGRRYFLQQSHWHAPSEHTINGRTMFDLELHVVHRDPFSERIAVFSTLYNIGSPDPFLSKLLPYIRALKDERRKKVAIRRLDPNLIGVDSKTFYRYNGSLTTPPCSENVIWIVNPAIRSVSSEQLDTLKAAVHHKSNARPLQPLNGREINLFYPMPYQEYASS